MFQQLELLVSDSILGLMAKYRADTYAQKVDLGVGVFRDLSGNTPILKSVRRAENEVLAAQTTKSYVGAAGREEFNAALEELVLGAAHPARRDRRARTLQTPGGCGALRVGAELIKAAAPGLAPKTWYGMPAYAKDGNIICFVQNAGKFKARYQTLGFSDKAKLDDGAMWPNSYALVKLTAADEAKITALVKKAVR